MPKLAQVYANSVGLKLPEKPNKFPSNFYPIKDKYIVLHAGASEKSREYDHFSLVVDFLNPVLQKHGIDIIQIGGKDDNYVSGTINYLGNLSLRQTTFVVENAMLYFGSDSAWSHVAGNYNIPIVALYSINPPHIAAPFYAKNITTLEPERNSDKPYFDEQEPIKSINTIKPEIIANEIINKIGINELVSLQTEVIGDNYHIHQADIIPDTFINVEKFKSTKVCIRMDAYFSVQEAAFILSHLPAVIVTNKGLPLSFLGKFKHNIKHIVFKINKDTPTRDVESLTASGISHQLVTEEVDKDLNDLKLRLFDHSQIFSVSKRESVNPEYYFMTNRVFFSREGVFPSLAHFEEKNYFQEGPMPIGHYFNNNKFLESVDNYYITKNKQIWDDQRKQQTR